jgi:hypothetical protein
LVFAQRSKRLAARARSQQTLFSRGIRTGDETRVSIPNALKYSNTYVPHTHSALRTFTDCLPTTSSGGLQHEFFSTLPPVQDRPRPEMVRADHVSDLPELSQLSGSNGTSQTDPERVRRLARRLESAYFPRGQFASARQPR